MPHDALEGRLGIQGCGGSCRGQETQGQVPDPQHPQAQPQTSPSTSSVCLALAREVGDPPGPAGLPNAEGAQLTCPMSGCHTKNP